MSTRLAVSIQNASLHGDVLLPGGTAKEIPRCIAFIFSGSGPTDSDGNQPGLVLNNLRDLAHALAEFGIATLRIDKRGVGRSQGAAVDEAQLTFETYVQDAVQWMAWLKERFSSVPIVLLGHSEGGLIATLAAQRMPVSGVVALCAPTRRASDILRSQLIGKLPEPLAQTSDEMLDALVSGQSCPACPEELMVLYRPSVQPYLRSWFQYEPQTESAKLSCPVLWIWGDHDEQLPREWLHLRSSQTHVRIPDMNHAMRSTLSPESIHAQIIECVREFCV